MRILLTANDASDAAAIEAEAASRGYDVVRCGAPGELPPCMDGRAPGSCPLEQHVDVAIDVRGAANGDLTHAEVGIICAVRDGVPVIVVGTNPIGAAATTAAEEAVLDAAVLAARRDDGRPPLSAVVRQARTTLAELTTGCEVTWAGYRDRHNMFDLVVELSRPVALATRVELEATLTTLFWQAIAAHRFGALIIEQRHQRTM